MLKVLARRWQLEAAAPLIAHSPYKYAFNNFVWLTWSHEALVSQTPCRRESRGLDVRGHSDIETRSCCPIAPAPRLARRIALIGIGNVRVYEHAIVVASAKRL